MILDLQADQAASRILTTMTDVRPPPFFVGDSAALDFLNSTAAPRSFDLEWLATGEDVLDWLAAANLLGEDEKSVLKQTRHRAALELAASDIRAFREEFRAFVHQVVAEKRIPEGHPIVEKLDKLIQNGRQSLRLVPHEHDTGRYNLRVIHSIETPEDLLPRIANGCAEFVAEPDFTYVRRCEGSGCTLFFRDVSKNHKRRWCSMEVCGNRAKAAAYRKRS